MVFVYAIQLMPYCKVTLSLGPSSALGGKGKKSERSEPRGVVWGGERVAIFPILPRFLPFSPTAEPGPKLCGECAGRF